MRLLLMGPAYPYRGGIAASNEQLARVLQQQGHEVELCTFRLQYPSLLFPGKSQFSQAPPPTDLTILRCLNSINPFNWIIQGRVIRKKRYDRLIVRYWTPFLAPVLGAVCRFAKSDKYGRVRIIALVDNMIPHEGHFWDVLLSRFFVSSVDDFVAMSQQVQREIKAFCSQKSVRYSPHPVYDIYGEMMSRVEAAKQLHLDSLHQWVLFFGLIRPYKGLDWLLEAWAIFKKEGGAAGKKLLVAGEFYESEEKYQKQITALGITEDVVIHNRYLPDNEVAAYFSLSDVVVQPYKSATQSGITQIAYHFNKPMIVTNVGGLAEMVPNGVVGYVTAPNPQAVADALTRFFAEGSADRFLEGIQAEKLRFTWETLAHSVTSV